jgi:hypothetical protein
MFWFVDEGYLGWDWVDTGLSLWWWWWWACYALLADPIPELDPVFIGGVFDLALPFALP